MRGRGKVLNNSRFDHLCDASGRRRVATAADEPRHTRRHYPADGGDVAVLDGGQSGRLRAAVWRIYKHDVGGFSGSEISAIQAVDARIAAAGCADEPLRRQFGQTRAMGDGVEHAERHDTGAGWRVGGDDEPVESAELVREPGAEQRGAKIACRADLQRDLTFLDHPLEIRVRHRGRPAVNVKRHARMYGERMVKPPLPEGCLKAGAPGGKDETTLQGSRRSSLLQPPW